MRCASDGAPRRIVAFLGGSFDPVHDGHLAAARALVARPEIEQVRLLPCARHPWKRARAPLAHRLRMLALAARPPLIAVDLRDALGGRVARAVATLARARADYGARRPLAFVLGEDAFAEIGRWRRARELPALAHLIVLARPGARRARAALPALAAQFARSFAPLAALAARPAGLVHLFDNPRVAASSRALRARVARGEPPPTPPAVARYIRRHRLYARAADAA